MKCPPSAGRAIPAASTSSARLSPASIKQLIADDVSLWEDEVDGWGGTRLDAAMNIVLLDDYFERESFQRDKFKAAIGARPGRSPSAKAVGSK